MSFAKLRRGQRSAAFLKGGKRLPSIAVFLCFNGTWRERPPSRRNLLFSDGGPERREARPGQVLRPDERRQDIPCRSAAPNFKGEAIRTDVCGRLCDMPGCCCNIRGVGRGHHAQVRRADPPPGTRGFLPVPKRPAWSRQNRLRRCAARKRPQANNCLTQHRGVKERTRRARPRRAEKFRGLKGAVVLSGTTEATANKSNEPKRMWRGITANQRKACLGGE